MNYYNEIDPYAAAWLRELIKNGHIAHGDVDERSVEDVTPSDLAGYAQCHFFAGLGGWSYALRLAEWPDDKPVWTGSCPCQPFSAAGKGGGVADERHLWPAWFHLIAQCKPGIIFGEQVEAAINHGWLDLVQSDLEGKGYAVGAVGLPAAGVGAPHIRARAWFVAESESGRRNGTVFAGERQALPEFVRASTVDELGNSEQPGFQEQRGQPGVPCSASTADAGQTAERTGASTFWSPCDRLPCVDGKARPVEPGTFPLAHGVSARVGRLRAYGNAIVPQVSQEIIRAYLKK